MVQKCPICKKPEAAGFQPFCSKRCADVDLGRWLGDGYAIAGEPLEDISGEGPGGGEFPRDDEPQ